MSGNFAGSSEKASRKERWAGLAPEQENVMHRLSLDILTVLGLSPPEQISVAAANGYDCISVFFQSPGPTIPHPSLSSDVELQDATRARLRETGIQLLTLEVFNLTPDADVEAFRPALQLGASLGAKNAIVIAWENDDWTDLCSKFKHFCRISKEYGIRPCVEFMAFSKSLASLDRAVALIGVAEGDAFLTLDMLHIVRTGTTLERLSRLDPALIGYAQICDGTMDAPEDALDEAGAARLLPGQGEFPIAEFLSLLPSDLAIGLEVPHRHWNERGLTMNERAAEAIRAARSFLSQKND